MGKKEGARAVKYKGSFAPVAGTGAKGSNFG
jgi:hypothetical protein